MLKTYLYIPEQLNMRIVTIAETQDKSKAEVIRQALEKGITAMQQHGNASAEVLLKLAQLGKKHGVTGPKDSSANMDKYLWDRDWSKDE